ncbi:MAG: hypothetical protein WCJ36_03095 [Candidatus Saccharibacteria bacterium]
MTNSIDVIKPFIEVMARDELAPDIQIIGGVGSAALEHPDTVIDTRNKEVIAPDSLYLDTYRPNGSLRDLDVLVLSSDRKDIDLVNRYMTETVGDNLERSAFGIKPAELLRKQMCSPLGFMALKTFLSDRYDMPAGMVKSLFPFSVPIKPESLEPWTLSIGNSHIPIPNPAMSVINYTNRSIGGIRPKDLTKVSNMANSVFSKAPELRDWAVEGPGASQVNLGLLLRSLTPGRKHTDVFNINRPILTANDLIEHESFILPELTTREKQLMVGMATIKATLLSSVESNSTIVKLWQKLGGEQRASSIINND